LKKVAIHKVQPEMVLAREVYSENGSMLLQRGSALTVRWIDKLSEYGIKEVFVESNGDETAGKSTGLLGDCSKSSRIPQEAVSDIIPYRLREDAESVVQVVMEEAKSGKITDSAEVRRVVEDIVNHLIKESYIACKLADIRVLDDYTFTHSVNVCVLSVSIGVNMGYTKSGLEELGVGALLHDVGKTRVPQELVTKHGPLTPEEFAEVKRHTILGYEILNENPEIIRDAAMVCLQHHECYNGTGYPFGIKDTEIHEHSRIVAIADVFDALTADRVYKNAAPAYEAVEVIIGLTGCKFDPMIVKSFIENCEIYPVGSTVILSSGETGVITSVNRQLPTRPRLKLISDNTGKAIPLADEIDLIDRPTVFIDQVISFRRKTGL